MWVGDLGCREPSRRPTAARPGRRATRASAPTSIPGPPPEFGQCVHKLRRRPDRPRVALPAEPLRRVSIRRTAAGNGPRSPHGLPSEFGFPLAIHPHDPADVLRHPAQRPEDGPAHDRRPSSRLAQPRSRANPGSGSTRGCQPPNAYVTVLREAMAIDRLDRRRRLFRDQHRPGLRQRRRGRPAGSWWPTSCRPSGRSRRPSSTD